MTDRPPWGAVLAGGQSRRMGRDKATLLVGGRELGRRSVDALRAAGVRRVIVVGGQADLGVDLVADRIPGSGPLGAVITALATAAPDDVLVLPCDLPAIDAATVGRVLATASVHPEADAVVGSVDGRAAWPIGLWRQRSAAALAEAFDRGERSLAGAGEVVTVVTVPVGAAGRDADLPEDLPLTDTLGDGTA